MVEETVFPRFAHTLHLGLRFGSRARVSRVCCGFSLHELRRQQRGWNQDKALLSRHQSHHDLHEVLYVD